MFRQLSVKQALHSTASKYLSHVIIIIACLIVFLQLTTHEFLLFWDDNSYVWENHQVISGLTPSSIAWAFTTYLSGNWHPVTWLSFMLDSEIYGIDPRGFFTTNIILHTINSLLLYYILNIFSKQRWPSFFVALLFAIHLK